MRQRPNLRYTARGRPHLLQRLYLRVLNFCGRAAFAINAFFAKRPSYVSRNGRPSPRRSARASSFVFAVVVIVTSSPRTASMSS
jgi:hypothetical protein